MHEYTLKVDVQEYEYNYGSEWRAKPIWEDVTTLSSDVEFIPGDLILHQHKHYKVRYRKHKTSRGTAGFRVQRTVLYCTFYKSNDPVGNPLAGLNIPGLS